MNMLDFLQGASNAAASNVSAPVDAIAWLLKKAGIPINNPVMGSDWMAQQGLTREPQNRTAGLLGEAAGLSAPIAVAAKAPQIAKGLLGAMDNAAVPRQLNPQTGAVVYHGSPHKFDKFDDAAIKTTGGSFNKYGTSVSPDKKVAERYAHDFGNGSGSVYKIEEHTKTPLSMTARDFHQLQQLTGELDRLSGKALPETKSVSLELLLKKYGVSWKDGQHPIEEIKRAGFDSIWGKGGAFAESEGLVFDKNLLTILERK